MFTQRATFSSINRRAVDKLKTILNYPKQAKSAYILYTTEAIQSARAANPSAKITEIVKGASEKWRSMDEAAKAVYQQRAAQEKEAAAASLSSFHSTLTDKQSMLVNLLSKVKRISAGHANRRILSQEERDLFASLPQDPPRSAYLLFLKEKMAEQPMQGKTIQEAQARIKNLAAEWKNVDPVQKQRYAEKAKELKRSFEEEMRNATRK